MTKYSRRVRTVAVGGAAALLVAGLIAGCSSGKGSTTTTTTGGGKSAAPAGVLTVTTGASTPFQNDFNPFSPNDNDATNGMILEPLYYFDTVDSSQINPWLATGYKWNSDGTAITFTLRHGVTWNDGQPFSADDVAWTFQQAATNKTFNGFGLPITGATANGTDSVTLTFSKPAYTDLFYIAGKTMILPKHIWEKVSDPTTYLNPNPVGTGAYMVQSVTPQVMTLTANPHYYMQGMPKIKTIRFLSYNGNDASNAAIESGQLDWAGNYIPNIQQNYLGKDPNFHLSNIPLAVAFFVPNLKSGPTAKLEVRQAISAALNRDFISKTVYDGQAPATNPEALLKPNYSSVEDPSLASAALPAGDADQAKQILTTAGYTLGSDGYFKDPSGKTLDINIEVISGYTDYVQIVQIAQQQLKAAGIKLSVKSESYQEFTNDQDNGTFQMLIDNFGYTPDPYSYYNNLLNSAFAPQPGTPDLVGNYGGYSNPTVDQALATIAGSTDPNTQKQAFYTIEQQFVKDIPDIPLFEQQNEIEFNGNHITGFPTIDNPYASPAIYMQPDIGWVAMRLAPASGNQ